MSTVQEPVRFTKREIEIIELVAAGCSSRNEIASGTQLSIHTVDKYINRLSAKLPGRGTPLMKIALYAGAHMARRELTGENV